MLNRYFLGNHICRREITSATNKTYVVEPGLYFNQPAVRVNDALFSPPHKRGEKISSDWYTPLPSDYTTYNLGNGMVILGSRGQGLVVKLVRDALIDYIER